MLQLFTSKQLATAGMQHVRLVLAAQQLCTAPCCTSNLADA
jgi:hypothetical protein